jgi:hypothetical protein
MGRPNAGAGGRQRAALYPLLIQLPGIDPGIPGEGSAASPRRPARSHRGVQVFDAVHRRDERHGQAGHAGRRHGPRRCARSERCDERDDAGRSGTGRPAGPDWSAHRHASTATASGAGRTADAGVVSLSEIPKREICAYRSRPKDVRRWELALWLTSPRLCSTKQRLHLAISPHTRQVHRTLLRSRPARPTKPSGETHESLLEAVQQAVPELRSSQQQDGTGGSGASPAQVAKPGSDADADLPDDPTPEELAKYSQSAKGRVNKLLEQRGKLRSEVDRLKVLEPNAQAADQVTKYLRDNDISRDDFLMTLELASAMRRGDFKTFYEGVRPYVKLAEEYLGHSLPPDLQQQVQQGHMTTQAAQHSRESAWIARWLRTTLRTSAAGAPAVQQTSRPSSSRQQRSVSSPTRCVTRSTRGSTASCSRILTMRRKSRCAGHDVGGDARTRRAAVN